MPRCQTRFHHACLTLAIALLVAAPAALASDHEADATTPVSIENGCMMTLEQSAYCACLGEALPDTWEYRYFAELLLMSDRRAARLDAARTADRERGQAARKACLEKTGLAE